MKTLTLLSVFFLFSYLPLWAQETLRGSVAAIDATPLVGVNVIVKGTTRGVSTNEKGRFELAVPGKGETIVFSFIGFQTKEILYNGQPYIAVTLLEDVKALREITVQGFTDMKGRARKRLESIQSIPETVIVMDATQIEATGVDDMGSFLNQIPGISYGESQDPGTVLINVRGIPQIRYGPSPIALIIDGVYMADPNLNVQSLYDIQQVEVVKGAQGIFYGKNAIAGAINIITKQPSNEFEGKVEVGYGNANALIGGLSLSGPIVQDKIYFRVAGNYANYDGLIKNPTLNKFVDFGRDIGVRGNLKFEFNPKTTLSLTGQYSDNRSGAVTFVSTVHNGDFPDQSPNVYKGSPKGDFLGTGTLTSGLGSAVFETTFGGVRFTSVTSYTDVHLFYDGDYLFGAVPDNYGPNPITAQDMIRASKTINQEIRFISADETKRFRWNAGLFYQNIRSQWLTHQILNDDITDLTYESTTEVTLTDDDNTLNSIGIFAFAEYDITDKLNVSLGARNEFEFLTNKENRSGNESSRNYSAFQPKASIGYDITDKILTYASFSGGFRSGGYNAAAVDPGSGNGGLEKEIRPEFTRGYELGLKTKFWNDRIILNVAGFYTDYLNQQVYRFALTDLDGDGTAGESILGTYNLNESRAFGVETDVKVRLFKFLDLVGGYSYIDSEITKAGLVNNFDEKDSDGNKIPFTLESSFNIGLIPKFIISDNVTLSGSINIENKGKKYWFADNLYGVSQSTVFQDPFTLVHAKIMAKIGTHLTVSIWGRNLADTKYNIEWWPLAAFPGAGDIRTPNRPRTFGGSVSYTF